MSIWVYVLFNNFADYELQSFTIYLQKMGAAVFQEILTPLIQEGR